MSKSTKQRFQVARTKRMRALFDMVRNRSDWNMPINTALDEPALFAYLSDAQRREARESMVNELQEAVAIHTGEEATVFVAVNGDAIRYHVRATGHRAPERAGSRAEMRLFG
jgi:hypothetical protein